MAHIIIPIDLPDFAKLIPGFEKIQHYEAQIKTITEDFNLEREARVKSHERAEELKEEVDRLNSQIMKLKIAIKDNKSKRYDKPRYECDGNADSL